MTTLELPELPLALSDASGVPFYRQIVDQIAELIRSGELTAGQRLPSVRELTQQLLVSLITVRRAYADLEQARLIVRHQGRGTFVASDVARTSRRQARAEAKKQLREAVLRARQLGLAPDDLRTVLENLLGETDA